MTEMIEFIASPLPFSSKLKIASFYVVVMQGLLSNVQKSVMHVQSCCFAFLTFPLPSPSSFCKVPLRKREDPGDEVWANLKKIAPMSVVCVDLCVWISVALGALCVCMCVAEWWTNKVGGTMDLTMSWCLEPMRFWHPNMKLQKVKQGHFVTAILVLPNFFVFYYG